MQAIDSERTDQQHCRLWWALLAVGVAALFYAIDAGDVTNEEARTLLGVNQILSGTASDDVSGHAWLVSLPHLPFVTKATPQSARLCSFVAIVMCIVLVDILLRMSVGQVSAAAAGIVTICSYPALVLANSATPDGMIALGAIGLVACAVCSALAPSGRQKIFFLLLGVGLAAVGIKAVTGSEWVGSFSRPEDRWVAITWCAAASCPWLFSLLLTSRHSFWNCQSRQTKVVLGAACGLQVLAVVLAAVFPARWLAAAMTMTAGAAAITGVAWQVWLAGQLPGKVARLQTRLVRSVLLGVPACVAVLGTVRIFQRYNFMERVQAVVVISLVAFFLAAWLLQRRWVAGYWLPVMIVFLACKFAHVHVYLLERDKWHSERPYANAIRERLPDDAVLVTDMSTSPSFRYYLDVPVTTFDQMPEDSSKRVYALVLQNDWQNENQPGLSRWRLVRTFDGAIGQQQFLLKRPRTVVADNTATVH